MTQNPNLPTGTSPTLALVHPTEEEKVYQFKLNGGEWRGALTPEAYLRREDVLSQQELTRDGGITWWILVDTAAKQNALDSSSSLRLPLASCDTLRKRALVWQDGKVSEGVSHGIGSVFCAKELRGRGYAARLMQELGKALKTWQVDGDGECVASVLYSDIGKEFYAKQGWAAIESACVCIPAKTSPQINETHLPTAVGLHEEDLEELCKIDEALIRKRLEARPANSKTAFVEIPDIKTMRWHHAREEFVGQQLHHKAPKIRGAIVGEAGHRVWMYFARVWYNGNPEESKGNTLYILRLVFEDGSSGSEAGAKHEAAIASLLLFAQREAQEWNLEEVEIWNSSPTTLSAAQKLHPSAAVVHREKESIASLKWYGPHQGPVEESIEWIEREKYVWC